MLFSNYQGVVYWSLLFKSFLLLVPTNWFVAIPFLDRKKCWAVNINFIRPWRLPGRLSMLISVVLKLEGSKKRFWSITMLLKEIEHNEIPNHIYNCWSFPTSFMKTVDLFFEGFEITGAPSSLWFWFFFKIWNWQFSDPEIFNKPDSVVDPKTHPTRISRLNNPFRDFEQGKA